MTAPGPLPPGFILLSEVVRRVRGVDAPDVRDPKAADLTSNPYKAYARLVLPAGRSSAAKGPARDPIAEARETVRAALSAGALVASVVREDGKVTAVPATFWNGTEALASIEGGHAEWLYGAALAPDKIGVFPLRHWGRLIVRGADAAGWLAARRADASVRPAWESADDVPAFVPLHHLPVAIVAAVGSEAAAAVAAAIKRGIVAGTVHLRWSLSLGRWRADAKARGIEVQHASDYGVLAGAIVSPAELRRSVFSIDWHNGLLSAPGDPGTGQRSGVWPIGPAEVVWSDVETMPAYREALAGKAGPGEIEDHQATDAGSPAGAGAAGPDGPDGDAIERAKEENRAIAMRVWRDLSRDPDLAPAKGMSGAVAGVAKLLLDSAERVTHDGMSQRTAERLAKAILDRLANGKRHPP